MFAKEPSRRLIVMFCLVLGACGGNSSDQLSLAETDMTSLAHSYLYDRGDDAASVAVLEHIRNLSPSAQQQFADAVSHLRRADGARDEVDGVDAALQMTADTLGIGRFALTPKQVEDSLLALGTGSIGTIEPVVTACGIGYATCEQASFPYSATYAGGCTTGCTSGDAYDRKSNSMCEGLACDYRMHYSPGPRKSKVDGQTPAADCALWYYGTVQVAASGSDQYVGIGIGGPAACLLGVGDWTASYMAAYSQVW